MTALNNILLVITRDLIYLKLYQKQQQQQQKTTTRKKAKQCRLQ